ncbi:helix-turn-helix domain-containing protein [Neobacillus ginsengisoli]|uniref:Transcriptional regulator with XRE-family HTH domain n=1 Tax=Neobacillus ginsengisoli TaxID=904295 RepID=A0ABT9XX72_9BACI|nr:helix-turn-helix transcriptional regulator [Neobacillus ginsengisoli]MDQ0200179.1 transcriptional regulator with XRE-family HTH domain [Neobacillus ginsengisoli]
MLQRLSELRKERKWSLQDTADQLGIAKSTYAGYESGYREPSLQSLSQLADLFATSVDYILGRTEELQQDQGHIEITDFFKSFEHTLSIDGEPLSADELMDFVAFVRVKRDLRSKEMKNGQSS